MKKFLVLAINIILMLFTSGCGIMNEMSEKDEAAPLDGGARADSMARRFEKYCRRTGADNASFCIESLDGSFSWRGSYGDMKYDTPFACASLTKMYTATVLLILADNGELSLDDPLSKFFNDDLLTGLNDFNGHDYSSEITLRELASHTSGIADYYSESSDKYESIRSRCMGGEDVYYSFDTAMDMVRELPAHFAPGAGDEAWYSDSNYQLLSKVIEKVTGSTLAECFEDYIITPLGLSNTFLAYSGMSWDGIAPISFGNGPEGRPVMCACEQGVGGLISTASDMMVFTKAFFTGQLFSSSHFSDIYDFKPLQFDSYCYGLGTMKYVGGNVFYGHTGSFGSVAFFCPKSGLFITGTMNNCNSTITAILADILNTIYVNN